MTSLASFSVSSQGSVPSSEGSEAKKYILLRDTVAKSKWALNSSTKSKLRLKRSEQRVLKGSLWQEICDDLLDNSDVPSVKSVRTGSAPNAGPYKLSVESLEIEELTLQCAAPFLGEISDDLCRLLLAISTSEERFSVYSDKDRMKSARFINVGSDVIVSKRNVAPCRAVVRWKGRLAGKQGVWFGVEIIDDQNRGSGDSDGSVNNIRLFTCDKNNGMFVNIGQLTLVPPKRPVRKQKAKASTTPSRGSEQMTNGSNGSDILTNDLLSQTESELSYTDDVASSETVPLVNIQVNDRVIWPSENGYEPATVKWIGTVPEDPTLNGEILVGVEFDNPIGKGTGVYKNKRLFEAKKGHASLVPMEGLVKLDATKDSVCSSKGTTTAAEILHSIGIEENEQDANNNKHENRSPKAAETKNFLSISTSPSNNTEVSRNLQVNPSQPRNTSTSQISSSSSDNQDVHERFTKHKSPVRTRSYDRPSPLHSIDHHDGSKHTKKPPNFLLSLTKGSNRQRLLNGTNEVTKKVAGKNDSIKVTNEIQNSEKYLTQKKVAKQVADVIKSKDLEKVDSHSDSDSEYTDVDSSTDDSKDSFTDKVTASNLDELQLNHSPPTDVLSQSVYVEIAEPPPQFLSDDNTLSSYNVIEYRGIQGSVDGAGFMECMLYMLSLSTDLFVHGDSTQSDYKTYLEYLLEHIYLPLSREKMVEASVMVKWRQMLDDLSIGQLLQCNGLREIQKCIRLLLEHICSLKPLYQLSNDQTGYTLALSSYNDARVGFPTIQKLLERTCIQQQVKFTQVPKALILLLPRWSQTHEKIFPNLYIDITDVLEYAKRICHMCGDLAMFECPECCETEHTDLTVAAFCESCSNTVHKHSKRSHHMPVQLRSSDVSMDTCPILRLVGVLTHTDNHYKTFSEPFVDSSKILSESQMLVDETDWLLFDSKAAIKGGNECIPKVSKVWGTTKWLSTDGYEQMAKDMESTPEHIKQLLSDGCLCIYTQ